MAEEWGACGAGLVCARSEDVLLRYRGVWCADAASWPEDSEEYPDDGQEVCCEAVRSPTFSLSLSISNMALC